MSGVGFSPAKIIEPARLLPTDGVPLVYGRHRRAELAHGDAQEALADRWVRSLALKDWDLASMIKTLAPSIDVAIEALGGIRNCQSVLNLTAGHGLLHACLAHHAHQEGLEMVYWHEAQAGRVRACPFRLGTRKLPAAAARVFASLQQGANTAEGLKARLGMPLSTIYHGLGILLRSGLVSSGAARFTATPT